MPATSKFVYIEKVNTTPRDMAKISLHTTVDVLKPWSSAQLYTKLYMSISDTSYAI